MAKTTLEAAKCVYVTKATPDANYSDKSSVFTGRFTGSNDIYRLFMKFDLSSMEDASVSSMNIESASINLYLARNEVPQTPGGCTLYVFRVLGGIDENKITWKLQPPVWNEVYGSVFVPYAKGGKISIDITGLVKQWQDGSIPNLGIMIKGEEYFNSLVGFPGKGAQNYVPQLEIHYHKTSSTVTGNIGFHDYYTSKSANFSNYLDAGLSEEARKLEKIVENKRYKGIVVYPSAVNWEPVQRPHQLLCEFAEKGYLCFFCDPPAAEFSVKEVRPNLFVLNNEDYLLFYLREKFVIVLCTWLIQLAWADYIQNKLIWYDILDRLDFFSCYDKDMLKKHEEVVQSAAIVTYSAAALTQYTEQRKDALYLPNAVNPKDFDVDPAAGIPDGMEKIVATDKKLAGYFGAIGDWFDSALLVQTARKHPEWEFILIGDATEEKKKSTKAANIHFLGAVAHDQLWRYARHFDVCLIPFAVNSLTDSVSPVKLFEYAALGKPIVATAFAEIKQYACEWIRLAENTEEFDEQMEACLSEEISQKAAAEGIVFAQQNTWSQRAKAAESLLLSTPDSLRAFSNISNDGAVAALTVSFFDREGKNFFCGGAERYLYDLYALFGKLGYRMLLYQHGNSPWVRRYNGMDVISLSDGSKEAPVTTEEYNKKFYDLTEMTTALNIYSAFFEAYPKVSGKSIGISHGVAWDSPMSVYRSGEEFWEINERFIRSAELCDTIVSVDTNTANWFQTIQYNAAEKIRVIPNYVDTSVFVPRKHFEKPGEKTIILFPRRLYAARGLYLMLEVTDEILEKYPQTEIHLVGRGVEEDIQNVKKKVDQWNGRVRWYSCPLSEMSEVYKKADIVVIPTMYSEGTSLSCLEAMATANAVIATRVGGLSDLIIDGHNGIVIDPMADSLKNALEELLNSPGRMVELKQHALEVSKAFTKSKWEQRWTQVIQSVEGICPPDAGVAVSKLAEIRLQSLAVLQSKQVIQQIYKLLTQGYLIYVRISNADEVLPASFGRLQFLADDEEILSPPDAVYTF